MKSIVTLFVTIILGTLLVAGKDYPEHNALSGLAISACCPEFILSDAVDICPPEGACKRSAPGLSMSFAACKNTAHTYTVYPNDLTFTYTWTVTGGTPATFTGNPLTIVWGSGSSGFIKVVMSNIASGGTCIDSITRELCLIDGPSANFTLSSDTVCTNTPVHFTNTSLGGSVYSWDFGDGTTSTLANPPDHGYAAPGTYTVTLTATDMGAGHYVGGAQGEIKVPCGCTDTISKTIVVLAGQGPVIDLDCCFGTVCPGDTSTFCTSMVCNTYTWSVAGGVIISGAGTSCIKVKWNATYTVPTTVTLQSCPSSSCAGSTTVNVPVLYPNLPISGPLTLCEGASGTFSLPWMPGTYYRWTVNGGLYAFNLVNRNSPSANITFSSPGPFWVKCEYNNPLAGCNGVDSVLVNVLPVFFITGDEIVCEGTVNSYTANGPANWTITPGGPTILSGNGSPTINVQWTPGTYTVTATPLNTLGYCNASAIKNVEVVAKPILGNIIGPDSVCPGEQYTYSITSNLGGSPFVWSVSSGTGTIPTQMGADNDSVVVVFSGPGPWALSVYQQIEISPGIFCQSLTKTKAVNPFLLPSITGNQTVCVDDVETYFAGNSNPGGDFQWSISPSNRGTIQFGQGSNSVTIKWHGPGTVATLSVTTCTGTDTHLVTINDPPVAVASYSILPVFCLNDNQVVTLSTPPGTGYTYQWYLNNSPVSGATSSTLVLTNNLATFPSIGIYPYYVIVTQNGCTARSNIVNIKIEGCTGGGGGPGPGCDILAQFSFYPVCNQITLIDKSIVLPGSSITNYQWTVTGPGTGTFAPNANVPNPVLTVSAAGTYSITLTITSSTGCIDMVTQQVSVLLPVASLSASSPVCENVPAFFSAFPNNPNYSYAWTFGDGSTSYEQSTQHAYVSAGNYTVNLIITDEYGCVSNATTTVTVNPTPVCTITAQDTVFCPGDSVALTACTGMATYQWYRNGNAISGANGPTYNASKHGKYWVTVSNSFGCSSKSNKIYIYMSTLPRAQVTGQGHVCGTAGGPASFFVSAYYDANYTYSWSSNPSGAIFSPPTGSGTSVNLTLPGTLPATYEIIVDVTDTTTGCTASDTLCVAFYQSPSLSVPTLNICEGSPVTLTPSPNDPANYSYQWNTGATTPVITASLPGFYSLTITDKDNGCSATANAGSIFSRPDLSLFPRGCDTICQNDTLHLYIPLPLNALAPNNTYPNSYPNISWYDNGNYGSPIGTGKDLHFAPGTTGSHQISVIVLNTFGCVDTAGVFCLQVKECPPLSETDFGDAPENPDLSLFYPTTLANNGARHFISPGIFMGTLIDPEANGQPTITSDGDDLNNTDDEDGVIIPSVVGINTTVNITVTASVNGFLDAWLDFNNNGTWVDAGEHIFTTQPLTAGSNNLSFTVPATATMGQSYSRFRFRTFNTPISYNGLVVDGEVEDYAVFLEEFPPQGDLDFGDAPDIAGTAFAYPTLLVNNGARHIIVPGIYIGSVIDPETDGQPNVPATGDDTDLFYPSLGDDEDGVTMPGGVSPGATVNITVTASVNGYLDAWFDFNINSSWADAGEHIFNVQPVNAGPNNLSFTVPASASPGPTYVRYRFRAFKAAITYDGLINEGEVEDYAVFIEDVPPQGDLDFGDNPDFNETIFAYPTLLANNGARHIITPGIYMGNIVDAEPDGQPSVLANGDDNDLFYPSAGDDEDGVQFIGTMYVGKPVNINVVVSVPGFLNAWIDYNKNGDWVAPSEQVFINQALVAGSNPLSFTIPLTAQKGYTYLRFRFNTTGGLTYSGLALNGEVEDYRAHLCPYWNPFPTDVIHTVHMPHTLTALSDGDAIGVFYDDGTGNLVNAGLVEWDGVNDKTMLAYGDDPTTPDIVEGFTIGHPIIWVLCSKKKGTAIPIDVVYDPAYPNHDGLFVDGGLSALTDVIVTCDAPTGLGASDITTTSANLGWTPGSTESQWDILYGLSGFDPAAEGTLIAGVTSNPYALTGLSPDTGYDFYVRAVCGDEAMSGWAGPGAFTTASDLLPGDATCDGMVNVLDIITIINFILGQDPQPFCFANADINGDGTINVLDVVSVVNIINSGGKKSAMEGNLSNPADIYLRPGGIDLKSDGTLAGLEMEVEGTNMEAISLQSAIAGFELAYNVVGNRMKIIIFSLDNRTIPAGHTELVSFSSEPAGLQWGQVAAGDLTAREVEVVKHLASSLGVPSLNDHSAVRVFPNPNEGTFTIEVSIPSESVVRFELSDMVGRDLEKVPPAVYPAGTHRIVYSGGNVLHEGIYFLKMTIIPVDPQFDRAEVMKKVMVMGR